MPFLTINGVTVPTSKDGGTIARTLYGEYMAGYDGTAQIDVRSRKKVWDFNTKPIDPLRSQALVGLIEGNGLLFPYNGNLYASNGLGPATTTGTTFQNFTAADGATVYDENGTAMSQQALASTSSLQADIGTTNTITQAQATCSATTGFQVNGGSSMAVDTTHFWEGTNAIKVTPVGSGFQFQLNSSQTVTSTTAIWVASAYIYSSVAATISISIGPSSGGGGGTITFSHTGGYWHRVFTFGTMSVISATIIVFFKTSNTSAPFWVDGIQLENSGVLASSYETPTAWQNPGSGARAASNLTYSANLSSLGGFTVAGWLMDAPLTPTGLTQVLFNANNAIEVLIQVVSGNQTLNFSTVSDAGTGDNLRWTITTIPLYGFFVCTLNVNPVSGQPTKTIYWNGVLVASSTATNYPVNNTITAFSVASATGNCFNGRINNLQVLPYAIDQFWVSGMYAAAALNAGATPLLTMSGSCINYQFKQVYGQVKKEDFVGFRDPVMGWISQGRKLSIILTEV